MTLSHIRKGSSATCKITALLFRSTLLPLAATGSFQGLQGA